MIGSTVSHYKILEKIGEGGMGVVYKAEDTKLRRTVALKFLPQEWTRDKEAMTRFVQEAQAAAALDHPNICTVYEINEFEGKTYIAMAYIQGQSLKEMLASGCIDIERALEIAAQIAAGLKNTHKRGIIHRDIKPANIMITGDGLVKIMDFGLAKLEERIDLTKTATIMGTVAYMSPEQAKGDRVDQRTDIWSLGCILYEMIAGKRPFGGHHDQAAIYSILNEEPEPLSHFVSDMDPEIEKIISKCLKKDLDSRYQRASDLLLDLQSYQKNLLISTAGSKQQKISPAPGRFIRRLPWIAGFLIIGILALIFMFKLFAPSGGQRYLTGKMLVVLPFENLGLPEDEYFADGITEEITSRLAAIRELGIISRTSAMHYKNTDKTARQIGKELNVDFILEGTVRWERTGRDGSRVRITPQLIRVSDDTHLWSERYDRVFQDIFSIQSEIAAQVVRKLDITLSESEKKTIEARPTENIVAYQAYLQGLDYLKYSHAPEDRYRKALKILEQAVKLDPNFALAYVKLSDAHRSLYFFGYDHTAKRITKAKNAVDKALELQPGLPDARVALGYYYYQGQLDYDRALIEFSVAAKSFPNDNELLANMAYVWRRQGLFDHAIKNLESSLALSPQSAQLMAELAHSYLCIRRYSDSIRYCDRCIQIAPDNKWAYVIKAMCFWCWKGDLESARSSLEEMPDKTSPSSVWFLFLQEMYERNYQDALDRLSNLAAEVIELQSTFMPKSLSEGWACSLLKDYQRTKSYYESARILLEKAISEQPDDPRVHSSLGLAYASLGRKEDAIRKGKRAVELYPVTKDALLGPDRIMDLISIYTITGEYDDAMDQIAYLLSIPCYHSKRFFFLNPRLDPLRNNPRFQRMMEKQSDLTDK